jgi:DNA-binding CsgD family transcriptional regulator
MDPDEAGAVRSALLSLRRVTGLPVAFGGAVDRRQQFRISELTGTATGALRDLTIVSGFGLGGKVLALARPMAVNDYPNAPSISHQYDSAVSAEGLHAIVAVPVVVRRTVRAVLYGALRQPLPLGDRVVRAAVDTARELGQDLAVRDEVEHRLAGLELAAGPARAGTPAWEEVREVYAELRALAQQVDDVVLRDRLHQLSTRLAGSAEPGPGPRPSPAGPRLSPRELDVLSCVALGCTNADTARQLGLLPETVKSYLRAAMRKLGSRTRLEAAVAARRTGQLP